MSDDPFKLNEDEKPFDPPSGEKPAVQEPKDAATLILIRGGREVMMGQRAKGHVFMPDKWVFPGGRVDPVDESANAATELTAETERLLRLGDVQRPPRAFALAAVRETLEETGLVVGGPDGPELHKLSFICRAITPPYRPRRFDARFFVADAEAVLANDEPIGGDELLDVRWFALADAHQLDLPSITKFVLNDVKQRLAGQGQPPAFLRWVGEGHQIDRLT